MQPPITKLGILKISIETRSLKKKTIHLYSVFAVATVGEPTQSAAQYCRMVRPIYLIEKVSTNFELPALRSGLKSFSQNITSSLGAHLKQGPIVVHGFIAYGI